PRPTGSPPGHTVTAIPTASVPVTVFVEPATSHHPLHDYQVPAAVREDLRCAITHDHGVFDTHTTVSRQIHPWLHGDNHARAQLPCTTLPQARCLVHPQPHTVSQSVRELVTVP